MVDAGVLSIIPPIVAIVLALVTKEVLSFIRCILWYDHLFSTCRTWSFRCSFYHSRNHD